MNRNKSIDPFHPDCIDPIRRKCKLFFPYVGSPAQAYLRAGNTITFSPLYKLTSKRILNKLLNELAEIYESESKAVLQRRKF